jgi:phosphohistidine phosphatase
MAGPCELYLIRHGVAEERGDAWPDDGKRPLTDAGATRMRRSMSGLAKAGVGFDVVLTSPLVRARQTADLVAVASDPRPPIFVIESLAPGGAYASLMADVEKHAKRGRIALVGHEPDLGAITARLLGARQPIEFKKGAVCRVDLTSVPPAGPGALRWFLPPKLMRCLGKK